MRSASFSRSWMQFRRRPSRGIEGGVAATLVVLAALFVLVDGVHEARTAPLYGLLDEASHVGYVAAIADSGVPPVLGRDRIFVGGSAPMAPRDVRIPAVETGSAILPLGANRDLTQTEAIQPPGAYYALAPIAAVTSGRATVVALRTACALALALTVLILGWVVWLLTGIPLAGGLAAVALTSCGGLIRVDSWVTNGSFVTLAAALVAWSLVDALRRRVVTLRLALAAGFLAITHVIAVPLAAAAILVAAARASNERFRRATLGLVAVAAAPLSLWVLGNIVRYHWLVPRNVSLAGTGPGSSVSTQFLKPGYIAGNAYSSLSGGFNGALQYWTASPYIYDWRPIGLLLPLAFTAVGFCLYCGCARDRSVVGSLLIALVVAHLGIFTMLWLSIVTQGNGDYVFRYFGPTFLVGSAIIGAAVAITAARLRFGSVLLVVLSSAILMIDVQASPL